MMRAGARPLVAIALLLAVLWPMSVVAQTNDAAIANTREPIEVEADNGIEWLQNSKIVKARGNARAVSGDLEVTADVLTAHYRRRPDGSNEVWRMEADGSVRISTPGETAYGERGDYNVDTAVLKLTGGEQLRLVTATSEITAKRELEYQPNSKILYARGDASATEGDKQVKGDTITAYFTPGAEGKSELSKLEAVDNVVVITPDEFVTADEGVYHLDTGIATVSGSVKITRGNNQINGCRGEMDMNKGVSKIFGCGKSGAQRVRGLIQPESRKNN